MVLNSLLAKKKGPIPCRPNFAHVADYANKSCVGTLQNLGLGVLEEKPAGNVSWGSANDEDESETESEFQTQSESEGARETDSVSGNESEKDALSTNRGNNLHNKTPKPDKSPKMRKEQETNRLARLMGQRRPDHPAQKPVIEVLPTID